MMELRTRLRPGRLSDKWDLHRCRDEDGESRQQAAISVCWSWAPCLAGASAAASLFRARLSGELFLLSGFARRAHSIAAQGGINAAKNYQNDGDSIWRAVLRYDQGGDFRAREANVYRLAQISVDIIDQCVAQGVPFAREYSGYLANRSFGGAQVSRTFYARGQTGQQLLLGAYQALCKEITRGNVVMYPRTEMLDLLIVDGRCRGIVTRNLVTGETVPHIADAVVLATGGYGMSSICRRTRGIKRDGDVSERGSARRVSGIPASRRFTRRASVSGDYQSKLTSCREFAQRRTGLGSAAAVDARPPHESPRPERDYYLERKYPSFGNLSPRDIAHGPRRKCVDEGRGSGHAAEDSISTSPMRSPPRARHHRRALRQPVRDVSAHHG